MANNIDGYFSFGDVAERYIGLENPLLAIADRFAQWTSVEAETVRKAAARLYYQSHG